MLRQYYFIDAQRELRRYPRAVLAGAVGRAPTAMLHVPYGYACPGSRKAGFQPHTQPAHTESPPLRPTSPHAAWTARPCPPLPYGWGWRDVRAPSRLPLTVAGCMATSSDPRRRILLLHFSSLRFGGDAEKALRAAAGSGLVLNLLRAALHGAACCFCAPAVWRFLLGGLLPGPHTRVPS